MGGDHEAETGLETRVSSNRYPSCPEWIPNARQRSLGAKQELGGSPRSCLFGRLDSTSRYYSSSSAAKDFHLQLSDVSYLPIRRELLLVLGIWGLRNKSALENVLGSEWPVINEFLPPPPSSELRRCDREL